MSDHDRARQLRAEGLTYREIGTRLGVAWSTARRWSNPQYAEEDRIASLLWKNTYREHTRAYARQHHQDRKTPCPQCGAPHQPGTGACRDCFRAVAIARQSAVEGMWAAGWKTGEIGETMHAAGMSGTRNAMRTLIARGRQRGWDLPYRRTPEQVERIRAASPSTFGREQR